MAGDLQKRDFPNHDWGTFRPAITLLACPKCKSRDLEIVEVNDGFLIFEVRDGLLNRGAGFLEPGGVTGVSAKCFKCGHQWKPRKAHSIDDVASEDAGRAALRNHEEGQ